MRQSLLLFLFFFLFVLILTTSLSDPELTALLQFKSATRPHPSTRLIFKKWFPLTHHCSWPGLKCDSSRHVVSLNLSTDNFTGVKLSCGSLTASLGNLTALKILSLPFFSFCENIPENIWKLENLEILNLEGNYFSQTIDSITKFPKKLKVLKLGGNLISGEIPKSLLDCGGLELLDLSNNRFTGSIPPNLGKLKRLNYLNLAGNNFSNQIPSFPNPKIFYFKKPLHVYMRDTDSESYTNPPPKNSGFTSIEIASISSASAIVAVLLALIILYIYSRKVKLTSSVASPVKHEIIIFYDIGYSITYESVVRATGNFNASNCIGSGGFGATYKAEISPGVVVAIKRLSVGRNQGARQFHAEIKTLGKCQHRNLVTLIGYHVGEEFLIYNYMPGGNLEKFIQGRSNREISWRILHKIALDVAKALCYLHNQCEPRIIHRDIKPSNILLDNEYTAYISDFGLARLLCDSDTHATTNPTGTYGYVAPEYAMTRRLSDKADVYSYGVVILELLSDKKALDPSFSPYANGFNIVTWACMLLEHGRAREFFIDGLWSVAPHDDLVELLNLAVRCTDETYVIRPTMSQVVRTLKEIQPPSSSMTS